VGVVLGLSTRGMDVIEAIKTRRSVRRFKRQPVPDDLINMIIESGIWAPSAGNLQPWEFVIVKDEDLKLRLAKAALHQMWIAEAPVVIVACANERRSQLGYGERGRRLYCICDVSAAVQNMLLTAHALGLASCWVGAFHDDEVAELLELPPGVRPIAILPIGYPAESPPPPPRRGAKEVIHLNRY